MVASQFFRSITIVSCMLRTALFKREYALSNIKIMGNAVSSQRNSIDICISYYMASLSTRNFSSPPPDEWVSRRAKKRQRSKATAVQSIRSCCTLEELMKILPNQGSAPELVVQAALQGLRVLEWPLSVSDRPLLSTLLENLSHHCAMNLEQYDLSHLATFLGVCARAQFVPRDLLVPLQHRLEAEVREDSLKDGDMVAHLAALLTALSRLRVGGRQLWNAAVTAAEAGVRHAKTVDIAQMLAAFARVNIMSTTLYNRAMQSAQHTLKTAAPQDVVLLMRSLAWAKCTPSPDMLLHLGEHLTMRGPDYDLTTMAELVGACGDMGLRSKDLYDLMAQVGAKAIHRHVAIPEGPMMPGLGLLPLNNSAARVRGMGDRPVQAVTPELVVTLVKSVCCVVQPRQQVILLHAAATLLIIMMRTAVARGEPVGTEEWGHLDAMAVLLQEAGLEEERRELLRQMSVLGAKSEESSALDPRT